ncbi:LamG-like jellyroll fold domain-containing protein [Microbispora sp. H10670]|uniref:LamG-like jellyroll fold domain-containing protein n=1 Tax=Microbispora sp. H10670 TaxID=2729108 RepID=UPI0016005BDA|nr:LamG-like jellyroll fold domain-containing protein [Microbispora sp. H10670]
MSPTPLRRRMSAVLAALSVTVTAFLTAAPPAAAGTPPPSPGVSPGGPDRPAHTDETSSLALARTSHHRIEVEADRSATGTVYVNPDGSFTAEESVRPVRVQHGDGWVPVDPTLRRDADGAITTAATTMPVTFSPGGSHPLAILGGAGWRLTLTWPGTLPEPALDGDTATYRQVLPGVDLVMRAEDGGFSERLVVSSRAAASALSEIRFGLRTTGAEVAVERDGALVAHDRDGRVVLSSPPARMWDTTPGGGGSPAQAAVGVSLRDGTLILRPDRTMLADPDTRFPVTIDPSYSASRLAWTSALQQDPAASFWNGANLADDPDGKVMVGLDPAYGTAVRSFFRLNTSGVKGKHILKATFQITEKWAYSCSPSVVQLWWTGSISSSTTWNNQPGWNRKVAESNAAKGNEWYGCNDGSVEFDITGLIRDGAASGWSDVTLALRAADETSVYGWKRFDTDAVIAVDYNSVPDVPNNLTVDGKACGSGTYVGTLTPAMSAAVSDPDAGQSLGVSMYWAANGGSVSETDKVVQSNVASGSRAVMKIPAGRLADGGSYFWQAKAGDGTDTSALSGQCAFRVDTAAPPAPPTVTSADYPADGDFHGARGVPGSFTLGAGGVSDVAAYRYGLADPPTTEVAAGSIGGGVTVTATPGAIGINTLYVRSVDRAGNPSPVRRYVFYAGGGTPPVGHWKTDEGSGTSLGDVSGNGHPATATGGVTWAQDRTMTPGHALALNGTTGYAATTGPVAATDTSFSVAAWVRLTSTAAYATAVAEEGATASSMILQYDKGSGRWAFATQNADTANPPATRATSPTAPRVGAWTHLAGTYDAGTGTMTLYVDGRPGGTATTHIGWNATGRLLIGAERFNGMITSPFPGDVADVRVWDRLVYPDEVAALAGTTTPAAAWDLTSDGSDSSGRGHSLTPSGGVTFDPASGHDGAGGARFDGTGVLTASGPVVLTDQSFSASAWVRLTDTSSFRTAVCQAGTRNCAFALQYDQVDNRWSLAVHGKDVDNPPITYVTSSAPPALNTWTHLVGVYDAATQEARLYVNGQLAGSRTAVTTYAATGAAAAGRSIYNGAATAPWKGDLDHVRVFLGALSDAQVADLFNQ